VPSHPSVPAMLNPQCIVERSPAWGSVPSSGQRTSAQGQQLAVLRSLIWGYFWLLIFEGALRKWIVPSLSTPLLVVRDPLVLLIYLQALRCRRFPVNGTVLAYFCLLSGFILLAVTQITVGIGGGPLAAAYGLRTNFLHLPLIFIIPRVFSYADVLKLGKWVLWLSIPMTVLMVGQFLSPPDSWINATSMADAQQLTFAMGKIRAAGTFSYVTGAAHFFVLAAAFLLYAWAERSDVYSRWLLWPALFSVAVVQPVSGSRTLVLGCALVVVAAITFGILNPGRAQRVLVVTALICTAAAALSLTSFFREAVDVFMTRWDAASAVAGGVKESLVWRFFGGFAEPFVLLPEAGLIGKGIGVGTMGASALLTGTLQFLLAEGEWARVVLEAGPLLGFSFLIYRVWVAGSIALRAVGAARRQQLLAWLLAWDACRSLVTEQISQPTNLGFMVLVSGLCLAAMPGNPFGTRDSLERPAPVGERLQ
jgi:hypothetical protein